MENILIPIRKWNEEERVSPPLSEAFKQKNIVEEIQQ